MTSTEAENRDEPADDAVGNTPTSDEISPQDREGVAPTSPEEEAGGPERPVAASLGAAADAVSEQTPRPGAFSKGEGVSDALRRAHRTVQRNPIAFIVGGLAVGFALGGLLRASSRPYRNKAERLAAKLARPFGR
jgi:hypothetical protein